MTNPETITLPREVVEGVRDALEHSIEHHEYCGYGDAWERECAMAQKLPEKLAAALAQLKEAME